MNTLASAFRNRKIVSGWTIDKIVFGHPAYRNNLGWTATPVTFKGSLQFWTVNDEKGALIGIVKAPKELP